MTNTRTHRKARRVLRKVARIMHRIGDHKLGTKYQRLAGRFHG